MRSAHSYACTRCVRTRPDILPTNSSSMLRSMCLALGLVVSLTCGAQDFPRPPCDASVPAPDYPAAADAPTVATWQNVRWEPPRCLPWAPAKLRLIVALAGTFRHAGDGEALLARFGAISSMRGVRYWSVSERAWRVLIEDAFASDAAGRRRPDFAPRELRPGAELHFVERDNRSGVVTYRLRVLEAGSVSIAIATENVTPVRAFGLTVFPPGSLAAAYFIRRRDAQSWTFYALSTTSDEASALTGVSKASDVNRVTALYRYFTSPQTK